MISTATNSLGPGFLLSMPIVGQVKAAHTSAAGTASCNHNHGDQYLMSRFLMKQISKSECRLKIRKKVLAKADISGNLSRQQQQRGLQGQASSHMCVIPTCLRCRIKGYINTNTNQFLSHILCTLCQLMLVRVEQDPTGSKARGSHANKSQGFVMYKCHMHVGHMHSNHDDS